MFSLQRGAPILLCFGLLACAGAERSSPTKVVPPAPPTVVARAPVDAKPAPAVETDAERHARHALEFEGRGALDRAAESWLLSHEASPAADKLRRAAKAFEAISASREAREVEAKLVLLTRRGETSAPPPSPETEDAAEPTQGEIDRMRELVEAARERVRLGDLLGARARLTASELSRSPEAWSLLGAIHWRLGKQELAQRAWSRARAISGSVVALSHRLEVVPPLDIAPTNFNATNNGILFAAVSGRLFSYEPNLGTFGALEAGLDMLQGAAVQSNQLAELWTMPDAEYGAPFGEPLRAEAAPSGRLLAWRDGQQQLKLLSVVPELGEMQLEWAKPVGGGPEVEAARLHPSEQRLGVCFSADEQTIYAGTRDGEIIAFDTKGTQRFRWRAHEGKSVTLLATSPDGKWLTSAGQDGMIRIWELARRKLVESIGPEREVRTLAFFPDSDTLEFSRAWELVRMDWRTKVEVGTYRRGVEILRVDHSADARWTAIGHYKTDSIELLRGRKLESEPLHPRQVWRTIAAVSEDGSTLVTSTPEGTTWFELASFRSRVIGGPASALALSHDGGRVALAQEGEVVVHDVLASTPVARIAMKTDSITQVGFLSDQELLVSAPHSTIYDLRSGAPQHRPPGVTRYLPLTTGSLRKVESGWERRDQRGEVVARLDCSDQGVAANAARTHFVCARRGAGIGVYSADGALVSSLPIDAEPELIALSNDHRRVSVVVYPGLIYVGDLEQGRWEQQSEELHRGLAGVTSLAYLGDRWQLAAGSDGVHFVHADDATQWGGLHFLVSGSWFALASSSMQQHTDGDPMGIDALACFPPSNSAGTVFEFLRKEGALALLLSEQLPGQARHPGLY